MSFFRMFKKSAMELKTLRCLTVTAILIGIDLALKFTASIALTQTLKISFAFLALASIGMLFGPVVAGLAGVVTDVIGYFIKPQGAFNPLFTIVELVGAVIYGIFLYRLNPLKFSDGDNTKHNVIQVLRIIFAKLSVVVVCNLVMTPAAMVLSGYDTVESITAKYSIRVVKQLAQFPVDVVLLLIVLPAIMFAYNRANRGISSRASKKTQNN